MLPEVIRSLSRYNEWAKRRILDSARCTTEPLLEGDGARFDCHGRSPRTMPAAGDVRSARPGEPVARLDPDPR